MPICWKCKIDKPIEDFAFQSIADNKRHTICRACHARLRRAHYERTKATYIENERLRVRGHRERNRGLVLEYLLSHPCVDCGETDPVVLDFDHRDPSTKRTEVTKLAGRKPWPIVRAEIEKCDVRCASCHRKRTAQQFNWRRAMPGFGEDQLGVLGALIAPDAPRAVVACPTEMRICRVCHEARPANEFSIKNRRTGNRTTICRACQRAYAREHYRRNRRSYLDKAARRRAGTRNRLAALVISYLRTHACVDCGASDPAILDFDHRDGAAKKATVNALLRSLDLDGVLAEIQKCDVRCANCHRRRTARQFGWSRLRIGESDRAA